MVVVGHQHEMQQVGKRGEPKQGSSTGGSGQVQGLRAASPYLRTGTRKTERGACMSPLVHFLNIIPNPIAVVKNLQRNML